MIYTLHAIFANLYTTDITSAKYDLNLTFLNPDSTQIWPLKILILYFSYEKGFTFNQFPFALLRVEEGKVLHAKGKGEGQMFPMTIQKTNQALGKFHFDLIWPHSNLRSSKPNP